MKLCNQCGKPVDFLRVGVRMVPVDPEPVFVIEHRGKEEFFTDEGERLEGRVARAEEVETPAQKAITMVGYVPHRRTCNGKMW